MIARDRAGGPTQARGFTLVELMVVTGIIGMLASVAIPQFSRSMFRSKAAERITIMTALGDAISDKISLNQRIPGSTPGTPATVVGNWNPSGTPVPTRRKFDWTAANWSGLPMVIIGDIYYSYKYTAEDTDGTGKDVTLTIESTGDLDGDGVQSAKTIVYRGLGYSFRIQSEAPLRGSEDASTF